MSHDSKPLPPANARDTEVLPYFNQAPAAAVVPVRPIGASHRQALLAHFLALSEGDRYLRFGYAANDEQIERYVDSIDFVHHEVFGVFNRKLELIAVAHIAVSAEPGQAPQAEFGVSVLPTGRRHGIGTRLFERAAMFARNRGIHKLNMQCLTQNGAMMRIAHRAGMEVHMEGGETEACLRVPEQTLFSHLDEWVENATGQIDFAIKLGLHRSAVS